MSRDTEKLRVWLIDSPLMCLAYRNVLRGGGGLLVREISSCASLPKVEEAIPLVVVFGGIVPQQQTLDHIATLKETCLSVSVVVLTNTDRGSFVRQCFECGADAVLGVTGPLSELNDAFSAVVSGRTYVSHAMGCLLAEDIGRARRVDQAKGLRVDLEMEGLSAREMEAFVLIGKGHTSKSVASEMDISVRTVDTFRSRIRHKLGLGGSGELAVRAIQWCQQNSKC